MSVLDNYPTQSARDAAYPAASNIGRCIFRTDTKAIEVSDGTNYLTYFNDGVFNGYPTNTKSLDFDGSNDYVSIPYDTSLDIIGALSISAYVKFDAVGGFPMIYAKGNYYDDLNGYQLYLFNNYKLAFYDGGTGGSASTSTSTLSAGTWYHVAVTRSAARGITFYINGQPNGTATRTGTPATANKQINIGRDSGGINHLNGSIDEVAVFNSELSAFEISKIYNNKLYPPMVSFWRFEGDATDSVGSNDGTLNNFVSPNGFVTDKPY